MKGGGRELIVRRILVAVDASPHSMAALQAAADLAARFQAELLGLFIEDVNLLRLAELPFAQEVGVFSATRRRMDTRRVERQLRAQASRVRQMFAALAERAEVRGSFRVTRGAITSELLAAASDADMIIVGRAGWSLARSTGLGSTARAIAVQAPSSTLVLQHGACLGPPVLIVYDGSALAQKALAAAADLVERDGSLTVLVLADDLDVAQHLTGQAAEWLEERGVEAVFRSLTESSARRLAFAVQREGCGTLVLPARISVLEDEALLALLDQVNVPVLLVR
jgi:nucleotide-binding universal stress UspA family protein